MKTLLVLRHAKSSWKEPGQPDHDRPLNVRGKRDAPRVGQLLNDLDCRPELIVSSTAKRARKTAAKVAQACGYQGLVEPTQALYLASPADILQVVREIPDHYARVMLVGHNPGLEQLLGLLCGGSIEMPTAALARVELDVTRWADVAPGVIARLSGTWRPESPPT